MNPEKPANRTNKLTLARRPIWLPLVLGLVVSCHLSFAQTYTFRELDLPPNLETNAYVQAVINNRGEVAASDWNRHAFFWKDGESTLLPGLPDHVPYTLKGLTENGMVFGDIRKPGEPERAVLWSRNEDGTFGPAIEIHSLLLAQSFQSRFYSYRGAITPDARFLSGSTDPFQTGGVLLEFDPARRTLRSVAILQEFLHSPGPAWAHALTVIDGELAMTGFVRHPNPSPEFPSGGIDRAFRYHKGEIVELHPAGSAGSAGNSINGHRHVCGEFVRTGQRRPAYWDAAGRMTDIFAGQYLFEGAAASINDRGQVVGSVNIGTFAAAKHRGFLWYPATGLQWLTALVAPADSVEVNEILAAGPINNSGEIVVRARKQDGREVTGIMIPETRPTLTIARADTIVVLSWPVWASHFVLESAPSLNGPWKSVEATGSNLGGNILVTAEPQGNQTFFRLRN